MSEFELTIERLRTGAAELNEANDPALKDKPGQARAAQPLLETDKVFRALGNVTEKNNEGRMILAGMLVAASSANARWRLAVGDSSDPEASRLLERAGALTGEQGDVNGVLRVSEAIGEKVFEIEGILKQAEEPLKDLLKLHEAYRTGIDQLQKDFTETAAQGNNYAQLLQGE